MSGNIYAVDNVCFLLFGVGRNTPLQCKINMEGKRYVDITEGYRKQYYTSRTSFILMGLICVSRIEFRLCPYSQTIFSVTEK